MKLIALCVLGIALTSCTFFYENDGTIWKTGVTGTNSEVAAQAGSLLGKKSTVGEK